MYLLKQVVKGKVRITAISPGAAFTVAVSTFEGDASAADSQTLTHTNFIPNENTSTSPTYSATVGNPGSGYAPNDTITLNGQDLGGNDIEHDLTITVTSVDASGSITAFTLGGTAASGDASFESLTPSSTAFGATFFPRITGGAYNPDIDNAGTGYEIGYQFTIGGEQLGGTSPANDMTITVTDVDFLMVLSLLLAQLVLQFLETLLHSIHLLLSLLQQLAILQTEQLLFTQQLLESELSSPTTTD